MLIFLGVYCYWLVQFNITFTSCWYLHGLLLLTIAGPKKEFWKGLQELGSRRIGFLGTVQYFIHLKGLKCCIVPKEPIPEAQNAVLSLKNLNKSILERSSKGWPSVSGVQKNWCLGTIQHFRPFRPYCP